MKKCLMLLLVLLLTGCGSKTTYQPGNTSISKRVEHMLYVEPNSSNKVYTIYDGLELDASEYNTSFNIEHIFAEQLLETSASKRDMYNMRFALIRTNQDRNNLKYVDGVGSNPMKTNSGFYPGDKHKGDVARALMYMAKTYNLDLSLMIEPELAIKWHLDDPVDANERARATIIEEIQKNKNPFIEDKRLANQEFGESNDYTLWVLISSFASSFVIITVFYKRVQALKKSRISIE